MSAVSPKFKQKQFLNLKLTNISQILENFYLPDTED